MVEIKKLWASHEECSLLLVYVFGKSCISRLWTVTLFVSFELVLFYQELLFLKLNNQRDLLTQVILEMIFSAGFNYKITIIKLWSY